MITLGTGLMLGISLLYNPTATVVFAEETETMNETDGSEVSYYSGTAGSRNRDAE